MSFLTQGKTNWKYILIVVVLAVIVGGGILSWIKRQEVPPTKLLEIKKPEKVVKDETANWKTYKNEEYGFEIKYPQDWEINEETSGPTESYKKYYRLDIFYPKDIVKAKTYGNVAIVFFGDGDMNEFFERELNIMKKDLTRTLENVTIDNMKGVKGITYTELGEAKSMFFEEMLLNSQKQIVYKIWAWAIDLGNNKYQERTKLIISTLRFLD